MKPSSFSKLTNSHIVLALLFLVGAPCSCFYGCAGTLEQARARREVGFNFLNAPPFLSQCVCVCLHCVRSKTELLLALWKWGQHKKVQGFACAPCTTVKFSCNTYTYAVGIAVPCRYTIIVPSGVHAFGLNCRTLVSR